MGIKRTTGMSAIALASTLILAGCSSSSSDDDRAAITQFGTFTLDEFVPSPTNFGSTVAIAGFFDLPGDIAPFFSSIAHPTSDRCVIDGQQPSELDEAVAIFEDRVAISAGESLVLTSPLGTFATLNRAMDGDSIFYLENDGLDNIPAELTLDIPGDAFPAFSNLAIPEATDITDLSVSEVVLTDTSTFTWTPIGSSNTILALDLDYESAVISCEIVDDGSFTLPADIVDQTGPLSDGFVSFSYVISQNLVQSGNALMMVSREKQVNVQ